MIVRIIRIHLKEEKLEEFLEYIPTHQSSVRKFDGCMHHDIFPDKDNRFLYYSYTIWSDEKSLKKFRNSEFFVNAVDYFRVICVKEPQAWTVDKIFEQNG